MMRLAATLTTMRDAERQPVELRGTLRYPAEAPRDIVILDVSTTGFLAELPTGIRVPAGTRVRIAATPFGSHEAIAVRQSQGGSHGFAFVHPLAPDAVNALDGDQATTVMPFPASSMPLTMPSPVVEPGAAEAKPIISARASLAIMVAISLGLWLVLAAIVAGTALLD